MIFRCGNSPIQNQPFRKIFSAFGAIIVFAVALFGARSFLCRNCFHGMNMLRSLAQLNHQSGKHAAARTVDDVAVADVAVVVDDARVVTSVVVVRRAQPIVAVSRIRGTRADPQPLTLCVIASLLLSFGRACKPSSRLDIGHQEYLVGSVFTSILVETVPRACRRIVYGRSLYYRLLHFIECGIIEVLVQPCPYRTFGVVVGVRAIFVVVLLRIEYQVCNQRRLAVRFFDYQPLYRFVLEPIYGGSCVAVVVLIAIRSAA